MIDQRMSVAKMRMIRWMNEITREDKIMNVYIGGSIEVASIADKMKDNILKWLV